MNQLDRYQIVGDWKYGGMARVCAAVQPSTARKIALKELLPHLQEDQEYVERFRREVRIASGLKHDHIVKINFAETEEPPYYIDMEYLEGGTLRAKLAHGPLVIEQAVSIATAICRALHHANEQGIIHRDVTPANIMFDEHGRPVLTDFGIARTTEGTGLTGSDKRWGNPFYMSPEQVRGLHLDRRTDVFSLGAVLYEMVTGRAAFGDEDHYVVTHRILSDTPVPPSLLNPRVGAALQSLILKALAKNPEERFQTCGEMGAALAALAQPKPVFPAAPTPTAPPVPVEPVGPPGGPAAVPQRRVRPWPVALAVVFLALATLCGWQAVRLHAAATGEAFRPAEVAAEGEREVVFQTDAALPEAGEGVKLARYYTPQESGKEEKGEFGLGWRLHLPYRLKPSQSTREVEGVRMSEEVTLTDLVSGKEERFLYGNDDLGRIGYFPPGVGRERAVYVLVDGYYSLMEGGEHKYQFDREGRLVVILTGRDSRRAFGYQGDRVTSIWGVPSALEPDQSTYQTVEGVSLPEVITLVDPPNPVRLTFGKDGEGNLGYFPGDSRRWKGVYIMADGFRLEDHWQNIYDFYGPGDFATARLAAKIEPETEAYCPAIMLVRDDRGRVTEAKVGDKGRVSYSYDQQGRLAAFTDPDGKLVRYRYAKKGQLLVCDPRLHVAVGWSGHAAWLGMSLLALVLLLCGGYAASRAAASPPGQGQRTTAVWR